MPASEDVRRELDSHVGMKVEELMAAGWPESAARGEAERLFGDAETIGAECVMIAERQRRSSRRVRFVETLLQDVRQGVRVLSRHRSFALVAILTLGLGIGANVAVFTMLDALILSPLPYAEPSRLVSLWERSERGARIPVAEPNYLDWRELSTRFAGMAAYRGPFPTPVLGGELPVRRSVSIVTGEFFDVMGVTAKAGRLPAATEVTPGAASVAVVSDRFWQSVLGGARDLSGVRLEVGGQQLPVVAVLPAAFDFPVGTDVWVPRWPDAGGTRTSHNYEVVARLGDGAGLEAARAEMRAIGGQLAEQYAGAIDAVTVEVSSLSEDLYGSYRTPLLLLLGAAGLVLLVACTNLASSVLARSVVRQREVAVRTALGGSRRRIVRQFFTENLLLALAGGVAGLGLASAVLATLRSLAPAEVLELRDTSVSGLVLLFTFCASVTAALLFGLVPALRADDRGAAGVLRGGDRGGTHRGRSVWGTLVAAEVAIALILLVASGLLIRSFRQTMTVDPGFEADDVVTVNLYVPQSAYPDDAALIALHESLMGALESTPSVSAAGLVSSLPLTGGVNGGVDIEGATSMGYAEYRVADRGYFEVMGIPLVRGRLFDGTEAQGGPEVALVDETFARTQFPEGDAVGRRIRNLRNDAFIYGTDNWLTIVGVVGAVRQRGILRDPDPTVYVAASQRPWRARDGVITIRPAGGVSDATAAARTTIGRLAPSVPFETGTARAQIGRELADRRFAMFVIGGFGVIALALAAIGIHGVVAWAVERRRREMGVRIALGAAPGGVARRVVFDAMIPVVVGLALGLAASFGLRRFVESMLVAVAPSDPLTLMASLALLGTVAWVACALPAHRIARIDPIEALRAE